jgi:hypothetical protein
METCRALPGLLGGLTSTIVLVSTGAAREDNRTFYDVTTEIRMPNLEENLRYTITNERLCLTHDALHRLFPILNHPALAGCYLGQQSAGDAGTRYPLICSGKHGACVC